ncbi:hypothetical protein BSKO_00527 [Bryopsis sp. KO-2023]|nr:hypothetical protein BSKO_00527 [Bryopsis sp. KO-2023]
MNELKVPVIDLSLDEKTVGELIYQACTTVGFFYISNHGLPESFKNDYFSKMEKLFALPLEEKMKVLQDENNKGYTPFEEETLDGPNQSKGDTKEGFYFSREIAADSEEAKLPLHGPNQWPDESVLPGFRKATEEYQAAMTDLGNRLLGFFDLALGLPKGFFLKKFERPMAFLRLLKYSSEVSDPTKGIFAAGAHSDYGMLTILANDDVPGLQINIKGTWTDVQPIPGTFIINIGDMLERWTNGKFMSTVHRVLNLEGRVRYSAPFFYDPNFETLVEVIPSCCDGKKPAYPPIMSGQHLLDKYASTHEGYAGPITA